MMRQQLPSTPGVWDESDSGGGAILSAARDHFAAAFAAFAGKPLPPGIDLEKYAKYIPKPRHPATCGLLVQDVTWEEVFLVLFPAHKKVRRRPCLRTAWCADGTATSLTHGGLVTPARCRLTRQE